MGIFYFSEMTGEMAELSENALATTHMND